ncbi:hypothetical protein EXIGLDRAFT_844688 [Exidia glandulosa HHB12029]|uniref:Hydrophobin n=1 Tax=Exidia glandulosa HHB12029 TaxID=1314781 RepID=A0A165BWD3_EXIGL|nr:hypothetical protein EXIGLDRAFT_844688 [Exidia glandulosa HHB12029]
MQVAWHFLNLLIVLTAPVAVHSFCCIGGSLPDPCGLVMTSPLEHGIFNAAAGVPKGAKNVLSNATFNAIEPLAICCCTAANNLACRNQCFDGLVIVDSE